MRCFDNPVYLFISRGRSRRIVFRFMMVLALVFFSLMLWLFTIYDRALAICFPIGQVGFLIVSLLYAFNCAAAVSATTDPVFASVRQGVTDQVVITGLTPFVWMTGRLTSAAVFWCEITALYLPLMVLCWTLGGVQWTQPPIICLLVLVNYISLNFFGLWLGRSAGRALLIIVLFGAIIIATLSSLFLFLNPQACGEEHFLSSPFAVFSGVNPLIPILQSIDDFGALPVLRRGVEILNAKLPLPWTLAGLLVFHGCFWIMAALGIMVGPFRCHNDDVDASFAKPKDKRSFSLNLGAVMPLEPQIQERAFNVFDLMRHFQLNALSGRTWLLETLHASWVTCVVAVAATMMVIHAYGASPGMVSFKYARWFTALILASNLFGLLFTWAKVFDGKFRPGLIAAGYANWLLRAAILISCLWLIVGDWPSPNGSVSRALLFTLDAIGMMFLLSVACSLNVRSFASARFAYFSSIIVWLAAPVAAVLSVMYVSLGIESVKVHKIVEALERAMVCRPETDWIGEQMARCHAEFFNRLSLAVMMIAVVLAIRWWAQAKGRKINNVDIRMEHEKTLKRRTTHCRVLVLLAILASGLSVRGAETAEAAKASDAAEIVPFGYYLRGLRRFGVSIKTGKKPVSGVLELLDNPNESRVLNPDVHGESWTSLAKMSVSVPANEQRIIFFSESDFLTSFISGFERYLRFVTPDSDKSRLWPVKTCRALFITGDSGEARAEKCSLAQGDYVIGIVGRPNCLPDHLEGMNMSVFLGLDQLNQLTDAQLENVQEFMFEGGSLTVIDNLDGEDVGERIRSLASLTFGRKRHRLSAAVLEAICQRPFDQKRMPVKRTVSLPQDDNVGVIMKGIDIYARSYGNGAFQYVPFDLAANPVFADVPPKSWMNILFYFRFSRLGDTPFSQLPSPRKSMDGDSLSSLAYIAGTPIILFFIAFFIVFMIGFVLPRYVGDDFFEKNPMRRLILNLAWAVIAILILVGAKHMFSGQTVSYRLKEHATSYFNVDRRRIKDVVQVRAESPTSVKLAWKEPPTTANFFKHDAFGYGFGNFPPIPGFKSGDKTLSFNLSTFDVKTVEAQRTVQGKWSIASNVVAENNDAISGWVRNDTNLTFKNGLILYPLVNNECPDRDDTGTKESVGFKSSPFFHEEFNCVTIPKLAPGETFKLDGVKPQIGRIGNLSGVEFSTESLVKETFQLNGSKLQRHGDPRASYSFLWCGFPENSIWTPTVNGEDKPEKRLRWVSQWLNGRFTSFPRRNQELTVNLRGWLKPPPKSDETNKESLFEKTTPEVSDSTLSASNPLYGRPPSLDLYGNIENAVLTFNYVYTPAASTDKANDIDDANVWVLDVEQGKWSRIHRFTLNSIDDANLETLRKTLNQLRLNDGQRSYEATSLFSLFGSARRGDGPISEDSRSINISIPNLERRLMDRLRGFYFKFTFDGEGHVEIINPELRFVER